MNNDITVPHAPPMGNVHRNELLKRVVRNRWLYFMLLPGLVYFIIFKYIPMYGVLLAFKNYQPFLGFLKSDWVGMKHFERFFGDPLFWTLLKNTFILAIYNILFFFPLPILIALLLNELRKEGFKRIIQTLIYIPHFMSWVVIVSIAYLFFTTEGGLVNEAIALPEASVTRADFIKLLVGTFGLTASVDRSFADVKDGDYYFEAVGIARKLGIVEGEGENLFHPAEPITRQDVMVILSRALTQVNKQLPMASQEVISGYADHGLIAAYAVNGVGDLVKSGLVEGSGGKLEPLRYSTRAEAAVMLFRLFNYIFGE